jgi:uncharacterized protein (DUF952 family)
MIYHITSREEWKAAQQHGEYTAPSLASQGFIHCSTAAQVLGVANTFYRGQSDLVLLVIDPARLSAELRWEPPDHPNPDADLRELESQRLFPHLFGALNLEAVAQVIDFPTLPDGSFALPQGMP